MCLKVLQDPSIYGSLQINVARSHFLFGVTLASIRVGGLPPSLLACPLVGSQASWVHVCSGLLGMQGGKVHGRHRDVH